MKAIQNLCRQLLEFLRVGQEVILYALIFVSASFRNRASLGCELVAIRSQLTFYKESIRQKKQPRPRFTPAFRLLWVLLSVVWSGGTCRRLDAAQDGSQMASERFSPVVALEIRGA